MPQTSNTRMQDVHNSLTLYIPVEARVLPQAPDSTPLVVAIALRRHVRTRCESPFCGAFPPTVPQSGHVAPYYPGWGNVVSSKRLVQVQSWQNHRFGSAVLDTNHKSSQLNQAGMNRTDTSKAEHYIWGNGCDGWHLLKQDDLSVIEERVPPGEQEQCHYHNTSRQFFYILEGEAVLDIQGNSMVLRERQGVEVPPSVPHQLRNESDSDVVFLVISAPKSHGDRVTLDQVQHS